tara:strand:+ start:854 stop:1072 length:219 start_codon:yes stop_codon:yes gene_type:complete
MSELPEISLFELLTFAIMLVGVYVKLNSDMQKVKSRVDQLDSECNEVRITLKELVTMMSDIKLLLARKGLDD